jgi:hypothetical protein
MVMARRLADMSQKQLSLTDLVLRAGRDIGRVSTAFDAELLLSTLLGSVYSGASPDRGWRCRRSSGTSSLVQVSARHPAVTT